MKLMELKTDLDGEAVIRAIIKELTLDFLLPNTKYSYGIVPIMTFSYLKLTRRYYKKEHSNILSHIDIDSNMITCGKVKSATVTNLCYSMTCLISRDHGLALTTSVIDTISMVKPNKFIIDEQLINKHYDYFKLVLS